MSDTLLELVDVRRQFAVSAGMFRGSRTLHAVNGVSLALRRGEVLGLVGESGCGKSTLGRMLLGLMPASAGAIRLEGRPIAAFGARELARRVQPIFQDPYSSLNPRKTVGAIVGLPLAVHGAEAGGRALRRRVQETMELVGLPARFFHSYPNQLSGGQRQRVAIARALVMRPEILICDEPTSALDVSVQSQILNLLEDARREFNLTYLLISHNLAVVEHIATRVAVMYLGRIVEEADTARLFRAPRHPYTRALLASVLTPEPGLGVPDTHLGVSYPNPIDPPPGCTFHPRCAEAMPVCRERAPAPLADARGRVECHLYDNALQ
jgi:peptide/nickel transport system ATP-binding protein